MNEIDTFSRALLEQAKRFLEKAEEEKRLEAKQAFANSALLLGFAALEAYVNSISDELLLKKGIPLLDQSVLGEREVSLKEGVFQLSDQRKFWRLQERIEFLYTRHTRRQLNRNEVWWVQLKAGISLRNELTHPRKVPKLKTKDVRVALQAIVKVLDVLFKAVYKRGFPSFRSGVVSSLDF